MTPEMDNIVAFYMLFAIFSDFLPNKEMTGVRLACVGPKVNKLQYKSNALRSSTNKTEVSILR